MRKTCVHPYSNKEVVFTYYNEVISKGILVGTYEDKTAFKTTLCVMLTTGEPRSLEKFTIHLVENLDPIYSYRKGSMIHNLTNSSLL